MDNEAGEAGWISLMDYAMKYGVSLSTLRRHIKAGKIQYQVENGRYLLKAPSAHAIVAAPAAVSAGQPSASRLSGAEERELRARLQHAQEEIAELKMLVALYEEQLAERKRPAPSHTQPRINGY